jgi:hypothetical protein
VAIARRHSCRALVEVTRCERWRGDALALPVRGADIDIGNVVDAMRRRDVRDC